jgi:hypothetical protein
MLLIPLVLVGPVVFIFYHIAVPFGLNATEFWLILGWLRLLGSCLAVCLAVGGLGAIILIGSVSGVRRSRPFGYNLLYF